MSRTGAALILFLGVALGQELQLVAASSDGATAMGQADALVDEEEKYLEEAQKMLESDHEDDSERKEEHKEDIEASKALASKKQPVVVSAGSTVNWGDFGGRNTSDFQEDEVEDAEQQAKIEFALAAQSSESSAQSSESSDVQRVGVEDGEQKAKSETAKNCEGSDATCKAKVSLVTWNKASGPGVRRHSASVDNSAQKADKGLVSAGADDGKNNTKVELVKWNKASGPGVRRHRASVDNDEQKEKKELVTAGAEDGKQKAKVELVKWNKASGPGVRRHGAGVEDDKQKAKSEPVAQNREISDVQGAGVEDSELKAKNEALTQDGESSDNELVASKVDQQNTKVQLETWKKASGPGVRKHKSAAIAFKAPVALVAALLALAVPR